MQQMTHQKAPHNTQFAITKLKLAGKVFFVRGFKFWTQTESAKEASPIIGWFAPPPAKMVGTGTPVVSVEPSLAELPVSRLFIRIPPSSNVCASPLFEIPSSWLAAQQHSHILKHYVIIVWHNNQIWLKV